MSNRIAQGPAQDLLGVKFELIATGVFSRGSCFRLLPMWLASHSGAILDVRSRAQALWVLGYEPGLRRFSAPAALWDRLGGRV